MKICAIIERFYPYVGGSEIRYYEILKRLATRHEVHVYTVWGDITSGETPEELPREEVKDGIRIHRVGKANSRKMMVGTRSIFDCLKFGKNVAQNLLKEKYDVYDINHYPMIDIPLSRPFMRNKCVITWHEIWGKFWRKYKSIGMLGEGLEFSISKLNWDKHIVVSNFTANRLKKICKIRDKYIEIIPSGVREEFYGTCNKEYGKILFVGRLTKDKHAHDLLIASYLEAKKQNKNLSLHIVGDGPLKELIIKKTMKLEDVYVYGSLSFNDLVNQVKSSWILCLPSEFEGQGLIALEAQASGTPVVTTKYPLNAIGQEFIIDNFNGYVVKPSSQAIATAVLKMEKNWSRLSWNSLNVAKKYSLDSTAQKTEKVYQEL